MNPHLKHKSKSNFPSNSAKTTKSPQKLFCPQLVFSNLLASCPKHFALANKLILNKYEVFRTTRKSLA